MPAESTEAEWLGNTKPDVPWLLPEDPFDINGENPNIIRSEN